MPSRPTRRRLETGIYERLSFDGDRLGLEVVYKDAEGKTRRRAVPGGIDDARDLLAQARTRRVKREHEPRDRRVTFNDVADQFEAAHVSGLRVSSRYVYGAALARLRARFGARRIDSITKADVRALITAERREGLRANTIISHLDVLSSLYMFARDDLGMPLILPRLKPSERPRAEDDQRERRVLNDDELSRLLAAVAERERLYFRTLAETGARASEVLGLTERRVGQDTIAIFEQLSRTGGQLVPLKTRNSRRTIEITRGLAAELRLAAGRERVFEGLTYASVRTAWMLALERTGLGDPRPSLHDLRHTHVSGLIADGWDVVEVARRIGDTLQTTLKTYSHEFDVSRRSEARRASLESRFGGGMATQEPLQTPTDAIPQTANIADLQDIREVRR